MITPVKISCKISANGPGLAFSIKVDGNTIFDGDPSGEHDIETNIPDDEAEHKLVFELVGKTFDHTKIDADGNVVEDVLVTISDLAFNNVKLGYLSVEKSIYQHDYNGTGAKTREKFYGKMGCNGTVILDFTTPIYLWLLENM